MKCFMKSFPWRRNEYTDRHVGRIQTVMIIRILWDMELSSSVKNVFFTLPYNVTKFQIRSDISDALCVCQILMYTENVLWAGYLSRYSDELRVWRSRIEFRWGRDFPPVQTGPGAHPASCKMGVGCGRGVLLTTHALLVPRSWKNRAIPLPTLWATPGLPLPFFYPKCIIKERQYQVKYMFVLHFAYG